MKASSGSEIKQLIKQAAMILRFTDRKESNELMSPEPAAVGSAITICP